MPLTSNDLVKKIAEFYPELDRHGVDLSAEMDPDKNAWVVTLKMGEHSMDTHIEHVDAEKCLEGVECTYLGVQIGRFIENFCLGGKACPT